ncbi:MAG: ATP-binding cassette domain-containing protein [Dehalococcoidia bacterium]|nr:ATP-binding cassette domain-containing protein [Dehalococcoidia bacterium]
MMAHGRMRRGLTGEDRPQGSKLRILRRAAGLFRPYRWHFAGLVLLIAVTATLSLLPALLIAAIVEAVAPPEGGGLPPGTTGEVTRIFVIMAGLYLASGLLGVLLGYVNQLVGQSVMYDVRAALHRHLQRLPVRFYTATRTGEIMSRIVTDVNTVQQAVTGTFTEFLTNFITLVVALGLMFAIEWRLALLAMVVLPLWVYPTLRVGDAQRRLQGLWQEEAAQMSAHLEETLSVSGSMLVKTFGRQDYESRRFLHSNAQLRKLSIQRMMAGRWFNMATELFGFLSVAIVYWLGGMLVLGGDIRLSEVVAFAALSNRVFTPFRQIARINTTVLTSLALFERIFEYLDLPVEVDERPDATALDRPRGGLTFEDVRFSYGRNSAPAIDGVSFDVPAGQMVALVGPSGAGKTTVTYLLQRYYDPQAGRVLLDGHDLRGLTLDSISRAVGTVMQETYLFHTTLLDNIRYGRLEATDDEVMEAALAAGLGSLLERLPDGLETTVGERGYRLSGGEKQRVAIARAILKDPPVLILDEATSSLDSRLEREIRDSTAQLAKGRTTVVIAHRLSTVVAADLILVFDRGHIVERGRHGELLAQDGLYAALYHERFSHDEAAAAANGATNGAHARRGAGRLDPSA